jgi:hypothetical protein
LDGVIERARVAPGALMIASVIWWAPGGGAIGVCLGQAVGRGRSNFWSPLITRIIERTRVGASWIRVEE